MTNKAVPDIDDEKLLALGRAVLETEARAITDLVPSLGEPFIAAVRQMLTCRGRIVVLGMGKSGHIASKIAATFASTGTPAFFVHPGEASHGDMGMITADDCVLALSNSGETDELVVLINRLKRLAVPLLAMTGNSASTLARAATVHLHVDVAQEACPLGLAPTSSTTAALALGDALAVGLLEARGFTAEDFALSHPGGTLGRRLLIKLSDVVHRGAEMPIVAPDATLRTALLEMTRKGLGMTAVCSSGSRVVGIFTDGDLRRALDGGTNILDVPVRDLMTTNCTTVSIDMLAAEALRIMQESKINALLVVSDQNTLVGVLNMHDLLRARVL